MQTEYPGSRLRALLQEIRQRGLGASAWRAGYELKKRLGLTASYFRAEPLESAELCSQFDPPVAGLEELRRRLHERLARVFLISPDAREDYVRAVRRWCPDRIAALRAAADEVARCRFHFMGHTFDFHGGPIDWHWAPERGTSWPRLPWSRISLYGPGVPGDVKLTWELNRHQFWPTLARAYWLTGEDRYVEAWIAQITSWLDDNPPEIGVNWFSNLEHAIRIVNWWIALGMFLPAPQLSDDLVGRILGTMVLKARHIVADLDHTRINMPNNHLLGDSMGLAVMGLLLPDLPESHRWRELGLETLWSEAQRQIHPDGASFECAISYHRFVAYFYVLTAGLCEKIGVEVPDLVRRRLEGMFEFAMHLRRPDGGMPSIGDWDDGRTVVLSEQALSDFRPMLSTGAVLFGRSDMAHSAGRLDEETLWLVGPEAGETFDELTPRPPDGTSRCFSDGGYFISRTDWTDQAFYCVVRNGPFESHTHADLLNVEMAAFGEPLVVDPGTYTYNGPWAWRTYFRSARAHNALLVDGRGQTFAHRIFRWLWPPQGQTLAWHAGQRVDYYEGQHDGFRHLAGGLVHRRVVLTVRGEYWLVLDGLLGRGEHEAELRLQLAPTLDVAEQEGLLFLTGPGGVGATISTWCSRAARIGIARGEEAPISGWYSPGYGVKTETTTVSLSASGELPLWIAWLVKPSRGAPAPVRLRPPEDRGHGTGGVPMTRVRLRIEGPEATDVFVYRPAAEPVKTFVAPGLEVPVGSAWARLDSRTGEVRASWSRP
ncbi:MAG: alginate lyase family protein [Phycisphaerae bacterium]|nr:alginate lyase family protein [Phycisphaerae bacterium]